MCQIFMLEKETIRHAFLECPRVVTLWKQVDKWYRENISTDIKFSDIEKIFGQQSNDFLTNKDILNTKLVIYKNIRKESQY